MAEYMHLLGAQEVSRAGSSMREAASTMSSSASSIAHSLEMHQRFLDDWLARLDGVLQDRTSDLGVTMRNSG